MCQPTLERTPKQIEETYFLPLERAIPWTFRYAQVLSPFKERGFLINDTARVYHHVRDPSEPLLPSEP